MPRVLEIAMQTAISKRGVAVGRLFHSTCPANSPARISACVRLL
jgi:hypothetical protein